MFVRGGFKGDQSMERTFGDLNARCNAFTGRRVSLASFRPVESRPTFCDRALALGHRYLRDVDRAAAKAAFAIHEIIAPEVVERLGEAAQPPLATAWS